MVYYIIGIAIIWRILLFFISFLGGIFFTFNPSFPYADIYLSNSGLPYWLWSFANFDGVHYLAIAKSGYWAQYTQVFFPLYPLLIRFFHFLVPFFNNVLTGVSISSILFLGALLIFRKLLSLDYKEKEIRWILLSLLIFPTSFFFGSLYTESLFLLLVFVSFYLARKRRWFLAGIIGGLASGTKLIGIFLLPALLWEWHQRNLKSQISNLKYSNQKSKVSKYVKPILDLLSDVIYSPILYLVPLGLLSYMAYLQITFKDWLYFWHAQPVFGAERTATEIVLLPQVIWRYVKILTAVPLSNYKFWVAFWELSSMFVGCWLLVLGWIRKVRASYLIFSLLAIIVPTLTGTFSSMPRYILMAFPIFIVLGLIKKKFIKISLLVICFLLSAIFTILFTTGHWVS